jgi:hypothetical protein
MTEVKPPHSRPDPERTARIRAELHRDIDLRQKGYRERALKILPHVCASCGREFSGRRLRELTVHHKDHNFRNNPPDGSNWELLCLYCHDNEHEKSAIKGTSAGPAAQLFSPPMANPFENIESLVRSPEKGQQQATDSDS